MRGCARIQSVRERIVQQEQRRLEQPGIARVLDAVALQRAEIVGIPELAAQLLEELPVPARALLAEVGDEMLLEIGGH